MRNFLKITLRNLIKNKLYSTINIFGLSIGIVCSILIWLWVADEASFDKFLPRYKNLHQVWVHATFDGKVNTWRSIPLPAYEAMKTANSSIINSTVTGWGGDKLLTVDETRVIKQGYYVSEEFLEMFEYPLISGDPATVLDDPYSIVISQSLAQTLFKNEDPLGKIIRLEDQANLNVTGILRDVPNNSSFEFEYLVPWKQREILNEWVVNNKTNWGNYSFQVFVELSNEQAQASVDETIATMLAENGEDDMPRRLFLHPMERWRLHSNFVNGVAKEGRNDHVKLFSVIAIFILVIACINFMNLATARSERRAREVGIRKSLGSTRKYLILQFIGESLVISIISFVLAIAMTELVLPAYNNLVDKELFVDYQSWEFWQIGFSIIFLTGILAGSYPAFYLSSFRPVETLKGTIKVGRGATSPRKILVVMQFGFSILLLVSTVVIFRQIELVKDRDLGYDQSNLISIDYSDELAENYDVLKTQLLQSGAVDAVTRSNSRITSINSNNFLSWPGKPENLKVIFTTISTEYDYCKTMGVKVLHGRDFSKEFSTDTSAIVINKTALDLMGLEDPIGTTLDLWGDKRQLIGVVDNVIMGSPYQEVKPLFMIVNPNWINAITVRLKNNGSMNENIKTVESIFDRYNPAYPFDYQFADVEFQRKFDTINMTQSLATIFSLLAIFITGLGLFGLASFTAEQRTKEIGIRKVLGASILGLIGLMSKDFSKLVLIGFLISTPVTWYLLDQYLERYPIRVDVQWWIFPIVGVVALVFSLLIVGNQAGRVARANPARSLRDE
ncbi:ABC-type antimicrobial peptide transport system, permease component [Reichenbachiella faecimaris]|uniref:ABC-type antimicrobial peptide transport system, permease component n=1 Tax=Reichenbachiella faecimaris TaxID=692418 RepID=A0A1W2G4Y6_REIFA|nr:ABC-type antimicrobial peptide transport system, permease component [Reichenbachiella faecimaris]